MKFCVWVVSGGLRMGCKLEFTHKFNRVSCKMNGHFFFDHFQMVLVKLLATVDCTEIVAFKFDVICGVGLRGVVSWSLKTQICFDATSFSSYICAV